MINVKVKEPSAGPMEDNMLVNGKEESSMVRVLI